MPRSRPVLLALIMIYCLVGRAAVAQSQYASVFNRDPLAQLLRTQDVVVKGNLLSSVDQSRLVNLAKSHPGGFPLKVAVVPDLPADGRVFQTRDGYTHALHSWLGLGNGMLIVLTPHGISLSTSALDPSQIDSVIRANVPALKSAPADGLIHTVASVANLEQQSVSSSSGAATTYSSGQPSETTSGGLSTVIVALMIVVIAAVLVKGLRRIRLRRRERLAVEQQVRRLHEQVVNSISYADNYLDLLPDSPDTTQARQARANAATSNQQAMDVARSGTLEGLCRAEALLEVARQSAAECRSAIDRATGGTGMAVAVDGTDFKAVPGAGSSQPAAAVDDPQVENIPDSERAACFFCSRPTRLGELTPVTIVLDGKRRRVLACNQDVHIVKQGVAPQIRSVSVNGNPIPWYRVPGYDPYRDYLGSPAYYTPMACTDGGFSSGFLLGSLLNTYSDPIPYPVFVDPTGGYTADPFLAGQMDVGMDNANYQDTGSVDFNSQDNLNAQAGAGFDLGNQDTGGVNFGSQDTGGMDFGDTDAGGADFGDQDTGGVDFGSQDTGGMDFGDTDAGGADFGDMDTGGSDW